MDTENDLSKSKPEGATSIPSVLAKNEKRKDSDAAECALGSDIEGSTCSLPLEKHFVISHTLSHELQSSQESFSIITAGVLDDGYSWRKYGQKQIISSSAFVRMYYKCSHPICMAKKKSELLNNGNIRSTYRGQHNHPRPQLNSTVSADCVVPVVEQEPCEPFLPNAEGKTIITDIQQMGSSVSKAPGSLKNEIDEVPHEMLSRLMRTRDFISLLLTYPMKIEEEGILKSWFSAFPEWKARLLSTDYDTVIDKPWLELTDKAFRCINGFVPMDIIRQIERGQTSIFNHNDEIPEAILHLAVDLAVNQLIQTMFSRDYSASCYIRLLTQNLIEKRAVVNKIVSALEEKHNMFGIDKHFLRALWIIASTYESDAEVRVQEEINTIMAGSSVTQDHDIQEKMGSNRHLVIVVDADSNKKLDLQKVCFPTGIVVLITTELSTQTEKDDEFRITCATDLNIRTQDHLLPWKVFCSNVDSTMVHSPMVIQRIAVQIVKECHGHLLTIVLMAKYLKRLIYMEDVKQWELALDKLSSLNPSYDYQHSDRIGIRRVMVNAFVNIMWEDIDDTQKICLELSLFVHNIKIGVQEAILVSDWASTLFGYTPEMTLNLDEFDEYRRQAQYCIRELLERFVLFNRGRDIYLPIETYDIIKSLHTSNPSIIRHGALGLTEGPCIERWHDLIRIELMDNKIYELPESPDCPKLKVLLLQGNIDLMDIPDSFFNHMPLLKLLDLSNTSIRDLPPSVSKLVQLEKLYLRGCDLFMELPPQIGQLKNLQGLDLEGTLITHMPKEIGKLINLQSLTICFDGYHHVLGHGKKGKQIIPEGVISSLTELNYLSINVDPEDERWNENVKSVLVEVFGLKRLKTVSIYVPEADLLEFIPAVKSFNLRLIVGHHKRRFISRVTPKVEQEFKRCDNSLKFVNGVDVPNGVKINLEHLKALYLDRHMTIKSLSDFGLENLHMLQVCILAECNEMETIVDASYLLFGRALRNLEILSVFYMKNLTSISQGPSYQCLRSIALHTCPMLTTVFTFDSLKNLSFLEEIIIEDCPKVTTLISYDSPQQKPVLSFFLPKLTRILLLYLPELVNIFNGQHVQQDLKEMVFYCCPRLQSLSKSELSSKSLKIIKGESMWWEALKWNAAEWGDAGRPKLFKQIFSPINEEDMMNQLAGHQETQIKLLKKKDTQINTTDQDEFLKKRERTDQLEELRHLAPRVGKKSRALGKLVKATQPDIIYCTTSDFQNIVQSLTGQSSSVNTIFSEKETVQTGVDYITQMLEESSTFRKEDDMEEMMAD